MVQEATTVPPTEAPVPAPPELVQEAEQSPSELDEEQRPLETEEGQQEEAQPRTPFDYEAYKDDEAFNGFVSEREKASYREGQKREVRRKKEVVEAMASTQQVVSSLNTLITDLSSQGAMDENKVFAAIRQAAPTLETYARVLAQEKGNEFKLQNRATALAEAIATASDVAGDPALGAPYYPKILVNTGQLDDQGKPLFWPTEDWALDGFGEDTFRDFIKDVYKHAEKKGYERGVKARNDGDREEAKADKREGQEPGEVKGGAGRGRSEDEELLDPRTPIARIAEIRARQKAGQ